MPGALDLHQRQSTQLCTCGDMRTFSMGSAVFRIRTAHCMSVVGVFSVGTGGSGSLGVGEEIERWERSGGGGGGSANSVLWFGQRSRRGQGGHTFGYWPELYQSPTTSSLWCLNPYMLLSVLIFANVRGVCACFQPCLAVTRLQVKVIPASRVRRGLNGANLATRTYATDIPRRSLYRTPQSPHETYPHRGVGNSPPSHRSGRSSSARRSRRFLYRIPEVGQG